jgi:hypothetical protein
MATETPMFLVRFVEGDKFTLLSTEAAVVDHIARWPGRRFEVAPVTVRTGETRFLHGPPVDYQFVLVTTEGKEHRLENHTDFSDAINELFDRWNHQPGTTQRIYRKHDWDADPEIAVPLVNTETWPAPWT